MKEFLKEEWKKLQEQLRQSVAFANEELGGDAEGRSEAADQFCKQGPPERYSELLERTREAAELARSWRESEQPDQSTNAA